MTESLTRAGFCLQGGTPLSTGYIQRRNLLLTPPQRARTALTIAFPAIATDAFTPYQGVEIKGARSRIARPSFNKLKTSISMRRTLPLIAKIVVSVGLFYLALRGIDLSTVLSRINQINPLWIIVAIAATFGGLLLNALRWREIGRHCDTPLTINQSLRYVMIGAFFSLALPSTIGGDAVRLWLAARAGAGLRKAAYSVLIDRAIGLIALALVVVGSLPWSIDLVTDPTGRIMLLVTGLVALGGGAGFLLMGRLPWRWLTTWVVTRDIHACAVIANRVLFHNRTSWRIAAFSAVIPVLAVSSAWGVARSIAAPATFVQLFQLLPPVLLITMIPVSIAGWGLREAAMMVAFGYAGLPQADGLVTSILFGLVIFIAGSTGGIVWVTSPEKAAKLAGPVPDSG